MFNDLEDLHRDISAYSGSRQGKESQGETLEEVIKRSRMTALDTMNEFLLQFAAMGLDVERVDSYCQLSRQDVIELAIELGSQIPVNVLNSALGLRMNDSSTNTFLPLVDVADILHQQTEKYGGPFRTLVVSGLERDVYVRMARNIAE